MGYSVAAAIGAYFGSPKNNIIAIIGDGAMQMNIQELENIKSLKLPIKIFIINNSGYGMIKQTIDTWLDSRYVGCDENSGLSLPDFQKVSKSYGIESLEINNHNDLKEKIEHTLNYKGPIVCDVKLDPNQKIIPKVKSATDHGFLLSNKGGSKMTRSNLSKVLIRLTEKLLNKRIGSQIVRVLKATKHRKSAEENAALSKEMMHGKEQHLLYAKKD
mgnify:CR=1 FL=1